MKRLFTIIILLSLLESCGFLHKTFDRNKEKHNDTSKSKIDSSGKSSSDSAGAHSVDSSSLKKKEENKSTDVVIEFSDSSDHNKVEVSIDSNGKQVIKAEGKIKSVKTKRTEKTKSVDSSHLNKKDSTGKHQSSEAAVKKTSETKQTGSSSSTHKKKTEFRIPWYAYLIGIIVLLIALYLYRHKIVAFFIKLLHPGSKVYYDPKIKGYQIIYKRKSNTS